MKLVFSLYLPEKNAGLSPVILLHGRTDSKKSWVKLAPQIADRTGREVYALDARNHGESPWSDDIDFNILANDLEEFLDDHDICKAILVGHSLGGRTSIVHALRKVYTLDARNHGESPWSEQVNFKLLSDDLQEFLDDHDIFKAIYIGHSMGGRTSTIHALKEPMSVEKIIVEDAKMAPYDTFTKNKIRTIMGIMKESLSIVPAEADDVIASKAVLDYIHFKVSMAYPASDCEKFFDLDTIPLKKDGGSYLWQTNFGVLEKIPQSDPVYETPKGPYTGPALFLYGTKSFIDVKNDETIFDYFPGAKKLGIDNAGHWIHQNFPEDFVNNVVDFINA